jgi:AcrR family transcriptional regulator
MTHNLEDLRVRRTRKLLREALISLIGERNFDTITVGEIAARAMVSRAAFYRYYQDKYDLVEQIFEETVRVMIGELDEMRLAAFGDLGVDHPVLLHQNYYESLTPEQFPPVPWVGLFEHFAEYERLYRALLGEKGSSWFAKKMRHYLADQFDGRVQAVIFDPNKKGLNEQRVFTEGFVPMILAGQLVDAITWWLEHDQPYSARQMAIYCHRLMIAELREANSWE